MQLRITAYITELFEQNKPLARFILFISLTSYFTGTFIALFMSDTLKSSLWTALAGYLFTESNSSFVAECLHNCLLDFSLIILCILPFVSKILVPIPVIVLIYKALSCGFTCTFLFAAASTNEIARYIAIILPNIVLIMPGFLVITMIALCDCRSCLGTAEKKLCLATFSKCVTGYLLMALVIAAAGVIATLLQCILF